MMGGGASSNGTNRKGRGGGKEQRKRDLPNKLQREPEYEEVNVPDVPCDEQYPPPKQNSTKKADIYQAWNFKDVHKHVGKTPDKATKTFEALIDYLTVPFRHDLQKIRALFMWLCTQPMSTKSYRVMQDMNTEELAAFPRGFLKLVKEKQASYASLFALLCRKAGIKCVIIRGVSKSVGYEVGSTETLRDLRTKWNAVWVKDSWRLVHPLWASQTVVGHIDFGEWTAYDDDEEAVEGWTIQKVNEFFFFTDPHDFLHFCYPDDPKWQLLSMPYDLLKFARLPFLQEAYFRMGLKLLTEQSCVLTSSNGLIEIVFKVPEDYPTQMNFDLLFKRDESDIDLDNRVALNKYVIMNFKKYVYRFIIRFPVIGVFKLSIFGGHADRQSVPWIADFRLVSEKALENCIPLPDNPWIGFGFGYQAQKHGLSDPSHSSGIILCKPHQDVQLSFVLNKVLSVKVRFLHIILHEKELTRWFTSKKSCNGLDIFGNIPQHGEYIVKIYGKEKGTDEDYANILNYVICTEDPSPLGRRNKPYENALEKKIRRHVKIAADDKDIGVLKKNLDRFVDAGLEDKGDYAIASSRLEFLEVKKGLHDAINRRQIPVLETSLSMARGSGFSQELQEFIQQAEQVLREQRALNGFQHPIPDLNKWIMSELMSYKDPPRLAHEIMIATFLLLGEEDADLMDWDFIRSLMKKTGRHSMLQRFRRFDTNNVDDEQKTKSYNIVQQYTESQVRKTSIGAASFYNWLQKVLMPPEPPTANKSSSKKGKKKK